MLGSDLAVDLKSTEPLAFSVTGRAQVDQLHTLDTLKTRDFLKWQQVVVEGLNYQHGDSLSIDKVNLLQPYARFMINDDRTTNVDDLLIPQPADSRCQNQPQPNRPARTNRWASTSAAIAINDGSANFADFSLTPNFATAVQQLNGQIGTIDSRQAKPASVDIKGKVDRYAPVTIKGAVNPFDPMASLDIATSFKRVELTTLTPYSGKFAGYRIRKGRLNLDLHYLITKGQLKAENKVVVEQLQLGEKVDSPDAVSLPLKLAIALLKDVDGKISIELPVTGDLNNPQFSVMPIVWQTLRNLIVKAAAAPFKMIGGLVSGGGSEDLGTVSFAPGSSDLSKDAEARAGQTVPGAQGTSGPAPGNRRHGRPEQRWPADRRATSGTRIPVQLLQDAPAPRRQGPGPGFVAGSAGQRERPAARRHLPHPPENPATCRMEGPGQGRTHGENARRA